MILYISGPMTGIEDFNRPMFYRAAELLEGRKEPYNIEEVLHPALITQGVDSPDKPYGYYLSEAIKLQLKCNAIGFLPDWHKSEGAVTEFMIARKIGQSMFRIRPGWRIDTSLSEPFDKFTLEEL